MACEEPSVQGSSLVRFFSSEGEFCHLLGEGNAWVPIALVSAPGKEKSSTIGRSNSSNVRSIWLLFRLSVLNLAQSSVMLN